MQNSKQYDLEARTLLFAQNIRSYIKKLKKDLINIDDLKQLLRSSGSIGANYIEANESLSKKDFLMRIKISRKEAKETRFWLQVIELPDQKELIEEYKRLLQEVTELMKIFGAIVSKNS